MTDSNKPIAEAQTKAQGTGTDAHIKSKDKGVIYFELSTSADRRVGEEWRSRWSA